MTGSMLDEVKAAGWRPLRACADVPPSVFFPDSGGKYYCRVCRAANADAERRRRERVLS